MYKCDCGGSRCTRLVSRSTWFRHRLARALQNEPVHEDIEISEPLPVEEAPSQEEVEQQHSDSEQYEVKFIKVI
jgi:hypothetical protein